MAPPKLKTSGFWLTNSVGYVNIQTSNLYWLFVSPPILDTILIHRRSTYYDIEFKMVSLISSSLDITKSSRRLRYLPTVNTFNPTNLSTAYLSSRWRHKS
jgi:hypothetical protein